jgi:hypothetical protein
MKLNTILITLTFVASLAVLGQFTQAFDANDIKYEEKRQWCQLQHASCKNLCADLGETAVQNTCRISTLDWVCLCSNNVQPNVNEYMQTIPYFICRTDLDNCIRNCRTSTSCINNCRTQYVCSTTNPPTVNGVDDEPTSTSSVRPIRIDDNNNDNDDDGIDGVADKLK